MSDSKAKTTTSRKFDALTFLRKYAVLVIACLVLANQFYMHYSDDLSRWKGGGFGMYSEIHPSFWKVYVKFNANPPAGADLTPPPGLQKAMNLITMHPNRKNMRRFRDIVVKGFGIRNLEVTVWKPSFNQKTLEFKRTVYRELKPNRSR